MTIWKEDRLISQNLKRSSTSSLLKNLQKFRYLLTGMLSGRVPGRLTGDEYGGSGKICYLPGWRVDYQLGPVHHLNFMIWMKHVLTGMLFKRCQVN